MCLGQIDSVGQYRSCLDPEPDEDKKKKGIIYFIITICYNFVITTYLKCKQKIGSYYLNKYLLNH